MSGSELASHLLALLRSGSLGPLAVWWATLLALGLLFLPVSQRLLPGSADGGLAAGKLLALGLAAGVAWGVGFVAPGGLSSFGILAGLVAVGALSILALRQAAPGPPPRLRAIAASELLFLAGLVFLGAVRSLEPTLATTEKFMDFGFVQAILHAPDLPPPDPWYAGEPINYYYFGHFVTAFLVRLSGVPAAVGYNLMVATLFAASAAVAATLAFDAVRLGLPTRPRASRRGPLLAAGASATLLVAAGNLHPVLHGARAGYHYSEATRFVGLDPPTADKLITEFPAYSFLVADLHAHLLNLPWVLVFLHLLLRLMTETAAPARRARAPVPSPARLGVAGALLGSSWMTNSWDAPALAGLLGLGLLLRRPDADARPGARLATAVLGAAAACAVGLLVALPFTLFFEPFGRGIALADAHTPPEALAILYGWQLGVALLYAGVRLRGGAAKPLDRWLATLVTAALLAIAAHEVVYVVDGLPSDYRRANTVFKLGYLAFVLLTVAVGPMAVRILAAASRPGPRALAALALAALCVPPLGYLPRALPVVARSELRDRATLDGLVQVFARNPGDAAMARWLHREGRGQGALVEIHGQSFGYAGRMAVFTGIPTVLGWRSHETLWRPEGRVERRRRDVNDLYTSGDVERVRQVLERYEVAFVVVGELEQLGLPDLDEEPLRRLGEVAFEAAGSRIYRVGPGTAGP